MDLFSSCSFPFVVDDTYIIGLVIIVLFKKKSLFFLIGIDGASDPTLHVCNLGQLAS
jgi:hypothetical protein